MRFSTKKFLKDRQESYERSKEGELEPIIKKPIDSCCDAIVERHKKERHPLYQKANACPNKLALGCRLAHNKRTKPECEACL